MIQLRTAFAPPSTPLGARFGVAALYVLSLASGVLVIWAGVVGFQQFQNIPVEEQLSMPAVMPYDVEIMQPWLLTTGHIVWGALATGGAIYLAYNTLRAASAWSGRAQLRRYFVSTALGVICFWVAAILITIFAAMLPVGIIGGVQVGIP